MVPGNVFRDLNDLPDEPRLGARLIVIGLGLLAIRFGWPRLEPGSYQKASEIFFRYFDLFRLNPRLAHSPGDFGWLLVSGSVLCIVSGAFIFFRRGFWWVAEHRKDEDVVRLDLK